jgi:hypothetical protein
MAIVASYVQVQDILGIPGATWYAQFSRDLGGNYGWTFAQPGNSVTVPYVSVQDIEATPSDTWFAVFSTDAGNNLGWNFNTGGIVSVENMLIQDSEVSGPTLWLAYVSDGNINGGNNVGWLFNPPNAGGALGMFFP